MLNLREILADVDIEKSFDLSNVYVSEIVSDSRKIKSDCVYVCIKGNKIDGHKFISEAVQNGAKAIVYSDLSVQIPEGIYAIKVKNTRLALAKMWSSACGRPDKTLKIVAVTGTNGKTTVSTMIYHGLRVSGKSVALLGTLGGVFGDEHYSLETLTTPDPEKLYPLLKKFADLGAEYVVMEASSHSLELNKLDGLNMQMGVFTNITPEHLDFHGDMEHYFLAKARLFTKCAKGIFFRDDQYSDKISKYIRDKNNVIYCSLRDDSSHYFVDNTVYNGSEGVSYDLNFRHGKLKIQSPIPGIFTVYNSCVAVAALLELGISEENVLSAFRELKGVKGRMEKLPTGEEFSIFIDFAHTPDALTKLLQSVWGFRRDGERIITLFGCGGDRDKSKRSLMGAIASKLSDFVIITADNSRSENPSDIIDEIMSGFDISCPYKRIDNRREAIFYAVENAEKGDIILLCGKGHEEYEITAEGTHPFSERDIVFEALSKRGIN